MDWRLILCIPILALISVGIWGKALVDVGTAVLYRTNGVETTAVVEHVFYLDRSGRARYTLSFRWDGTPYQASTERAAGEPQRGDLVEIYVDKNEPSDVAMKGWVRDNWDGYLLGSVLGSLPALGAFLLGRRLWNEPGEQPPILTPRGYPGAPRSVRRRLKKKRRR